jgi:hypothetical protein
MKYHKYGVFKILRTLRCPIAEKITSQTRGTLNFDPHSKIRLPVKQQINQITGPIASQVNLFINIKKV